MKYYNQIEICWILLVCEKADELVTVREELEYTGHVLGSVAFEVYNLLMFNFLFLKNRV